MSEIDTPDVNDNEDYILPDESIEVVDQEATSEESSPETEDTEDTESTETPDDKESTDDESDDSGDATDETDDETEPTDEPKDKKNSAQNRIRSLANENREQKRQIEALNAKFYQPQTAAELQDQGLDDVQAQIEALRQDSVAKDYNAHVASINSDSNMEAMQVIHEFPIFDPDSKQYDKNFASIVAQRYTATAGIEYDENTGLMKDVRVLPYDFYKSYAEVHALGQKRGNIQGRRSSQRQLAATDVPTRTAPVKSVEDDPFLQGFDKN